MLTRPYATLVAAAAVANAVESYDVTNCGASTVTTVSATEELTVLNIDTKGITRSNSANKAFDNATYECASVVSIAGARRKGLGYCKFLVPDGDFVVGEQVLDSIGGGKWKFLQGTGKWKGITGGGEFVLLTSGKPIVAGRGRVVSGRAARTSFPSNVRHAAITLEIARLKLPTHERGVE